MAFEPCTTQNTRSDSSPRRLLYHPHHPITPPIPIQYNPITHIPPPPQRFAQPSVHEGPRRIIGIFAWIGSRNQDLERSEIIGAANRIGKQQCCFFLSSFFFPFFMLEGWALCILLTQELYHLSCSTIYCHVKWTRRQFDWREKGGASIYHGCCLFYYPSFLVWLPLFLLLIRDEERWDSPA